MCIDMNMCEGITPYITSLRQSVKQDLESTMMIKSQLTSSILTCINDYTSLIIISIQLEESTGANYNIC